MRAIPYIRNANSKGVPVKYGKGGILAQKIHSQDRKLSLRWLLGLSSIPLFGIITAFGIAPQTALSNAPVTTVTEELVLEQSATADGAILEAGQQPLWQADEIRKDDTLASLLKRLNIQNEDAIAFLRNSPAASDLASRLRPGRAILAQTTEDGELLELQYQYDLNTALQVKRVESGYQAEQVQIAMESRTLMKSAQIESSLFAATDGADIPDAVAMQIADIFSSDIDFHQDLRQGDRLAIIYEAGYSNGELARPGKVLAAEFVNQGKSYQAVLYRSANGEEHYYTPDGKSLNKAFLRSPIEFSRISSGFTLARYHPVLKTWRAHKGVDYASPTGTRIKATASGTVAFVGKKGGYGNVVVLKHANGISTLYAHLSAFAAGLRSGQKISQGDIIGRVGQTGLASGPHLHYEFLVNNQHRDPLKVALPQSVSLKASDIAAFSQQSRQLFSQLALLRNTMTASLD